MKSRIKEALYNRQQMSGTDWLVDAVIMIGAFGFSLLQLTVTTNLFIPDDFIRRIIGVRAVAPSVQAIVVMALTCLPLIVRRRLPWPTLVVSLVFWLVGEIYIGEGSVSLSLVGPLVALFTVEYQRSRGEGVAALVVVLLIVIIVPYSHATGTLSSLTLMQNMILVVAVALGGYAIHSRQDYLNAAEARAEEAEALRLSEAKRAKEAEALRLSEARRAEAETRRAHAEARRAEAETKRAEAESERAEAESKRAEAAEQTRETEAQRRVEEERVRIAREVHDITAHSLSAVSIQAAAAERLIDTDPVRAKAAIATVRTTAKDALDEMRVMIGVLRAENSPTQAIQPTQGTEQLGQLAKYLESAGVACQLDASGYDSAKVPTYIDVALFGIAREAVTNVVRHAGAAHAAIKLNTMVGAQTNESLGSQSGVQSGVRPEAQSEVQSEVQPEAQPGVQPSVQKQGDQTHSCWACLQIEDDGCGLPAGVLQEAQGEAQGHGIEGMRERVNVLGGKIEFLPLNCGEDDASAGEDDASFDNVSAGRGLRVSVSIPLPN